MVGADAGAASTAGIDTAVGCTVAATGGVVNGAANEVVVAAAANVGTLTLLPASAAVSFVILCRRRIFSARRF